MDPNALSFNRESPSYRNDRPRYPRELYDVLASHASLHGYAWDCGCGNGQVAIDLARYFEHIEACDINENQILNAIKHPRIRYTVQDSQCTGYPASCFDAICVAQCLHWFDLDLFFAEVRRVLKPGGVFACWGYSFFHIEPSLDTFFEENLLQKIDPYWSEKNRLLHRDYRDIDFPFQPLACPEIPMRLAWSLDALLAYLSTWSAVKLYDEARSASVIATLRRQLTTRYDITQVYDIGMDFFVYMGRV